MSGKSSQSQAAKGPTPARYKAIDCTLMRTMIFKVDFGLPAMRRARMIMSYGTPSTQWLTEDHITASAIQNHRFEKDRMSMTSKVCREGQGGPLSGFMSS